MEASEKNEETHSNRTERLAGRVNWGIPTVFGVIYGMLCGASKELVELNIWLSKKVDVMLKPGGSTQDQRERFVRYAWKKLYVRVTRGVIVGGVQVGMSTAGFCCLQNWLAEKRGVHDVFNVVGAGSATAAVLGLTMPGSLQSRARNVVLGSVLGAAICFPFGLIQLKLVEEANEGNTDTNGSRDVGEAKGGLDAAIYLLE